MSKYEVGQRLQVICESIDENGKAKFRVVNEGIFDGLKLDKLDKALKNAIEIHGDFIEGYGSDSVNVIDENCKIWFPKVASIANRKELQSCLSRYLRDNEKIQSAKCFYHDSINTVRGEAKLFTPIIGFTTKGNVFVCRITPKDTDDASCISVDVDNFVMTYISLHNFKSKYNLNFSKLL